MIHLYPSENCLLDTLSIHDGNRKVGERRKRWWGRSPKDRVKNEQK